MKHFQLLSLLVSAVISFPFSANCEELIAPRAEVPALLARLKSAAGGNRNLIADFSREPIFSSTLPQGKNSCPTGNRSCFTISFSSWVPGTLVSLDLNTAGDVAIFPTGPLDGGLSVPNHTLERLPHRSTGMHFYRMFGAPGQGAVILLVLPAGFRPEILRQEKAGLLDKIVTELERISAESGGSNSIGLRVLPYQIVAD